MTDYQFGCMYLVARSERDFFQEQTEPKDTNLNHEAVTRKDALMHKGLSQDFSGPVNVFICACSLIFLPFCSVWLRLTCTPFTNVQPLRMQPKET